MEMKYSHVVAFSLGDFKRQPHLYDLCTKKVASSLGDFKRQPIFKTSGSKKRGVQKKNIFLLFYQKILGINLGHIQVRQKSLTCFKSFRQDLVGNKLSEQQSL